MDSSVEPESTGKDEEKKKGGWAVDSSKAPNECARRERMDRANFLRGRSAPVKMGGQMTGRGRPEKKKKRGRQLAGGRWDGDGDWNWDWDWDFGSAFFTALHRPDTARNGLVVATRGAVGARAESRGGASSRCNSGVRCNDTGNHQTRKKQ